MLETFDTVIIGAGVTGLSTAAALGKNSSYVILEADENIGGYCKTIRDNGFVWDYSGHFFHFRDMSIEAWLRARMPNQEIRTVTKKSFIQYGERRIDFPFQKNIHQLPAEEFVECLHDLYFAQKNALSSKPSHFKDMIESRYGRALCEKFLIPYNEKLYATDLSKLDVDAMGRFFPHVQFDEVIRNMKSPDNSSYNQTFTYPKEGAEAYVNAIASEVRSDAIRLNNRVISIDPKNKQVVTSSGTFAYRQLVSSMPFSQLLRLLERKEDSERLSWNQVLVFNLGFDSKGSRDIHWMYYPDRSISFYRIGYYDNIFDSDRMSLYVEIGLEKNAVPDVSQMQSRVLDELKRLKVIGSQKLIASHHVVMNPAYVHMTHEGNAMFATFQKEFEPQGIFSLGRYGRWTYCSIEDNMIEARAWVNAHG